MSIVFLLRSLEFGGAERQLVVLASALRARGHQVAVVPFYGGGQLTEDLRRAGVRVIPIEKRGRWDVVGFFFRLQSAIRRVRPSVLHAYTDVPNIVAIALRPFLPGTAVVWGVRASDMDRSAYGWLTSLAFRVSCLLARFADVIVANSRHGAAYHVRVGYPAAKMRVVPNGIDSERFAPDPEKRRQVRQAWGIGGGDILVGLVARVDPVKDHETFLRAADLLRDADPRLRFVCVGDGPADRRAALRRLGDELRLGDRLRWSEGRSDVPAVYNALDILCSSSTSEAFSNVIAEAMAVGVPCVVTEAGDSGWIVAGSGIVVPPRDPVALATGITDLTGRLSPALSATCRERIVSDFSVERLVTNTLAVLGDLSPGE